MIDVLIPAGIVSFCTGQSSFDQPLHGPELFLVPFCIVLAIDLGTVLYTRNTIIKAFDLTKGRALLERDSFRTSDRGRDSW